MGCPHHLLRIALWKRMRFTIAVSAGGWIGAIALVATRRIGAGDFGSNDTFTGSPSRLPGDRFQFCPSH